jgi:hypothetical protein
MPIPPRTHSCGDDENKEMPYRQCGNNCRTAQNLSGVDNDRVVRCALRLSRTKVVLALLRATGPFAASFAAFKAGRSLRDQHRNRAIQHA